ncbi:sugar phosphate isomerase/epimerase family protein [Natrarchaeobius oligotrophus]|uniref:Sugar phosphate isomerase/epimerase n=1 Tax=Natrarchaeobius chitinivorans TaxID=1679083 RepID=A0A3N6N3W9_NATCH|nr:sugar phosphate isomerase/epimerase [Natrarchaeobius chitinivorans]RQH02387.1 sugar phosphate isomerase/epimerase [Natrarchaeobius chitinivorans]
MELGVRTVPFGETDVESLLEWLQSNGIESIECSVGGFAPSRFLDASSILENGETEVELLEAIDDVDVEIAALGCHNNPLHPDEGVASDADAELRSAIRLASRLDVDTISCFSGLPGGSADDSTPNWIVAPWPPDHSRAHRYQWESVAIPYWSELATFADDHDVTLAIEPHVNMLVHTPGDLLRLREHTTDAVAATFDPSHLYWQGIDAIDAAVALLERDAIAHAHAKDVLVQERTRRVDGVLDATSFGDGSERSWTFCRPGVGHGRAHWEALVHTLKQRGYDGHLCIEYFREEVEEPHASVEKSAHFLREIL